MINNWIDIQNKGRIERIATNRRKLASFKGGYVSITDLKKYFAPLTHKLWGLLEEHVEPKNVDNIPEINIRLITFEIYELGVEYNYSKYHKADSELALPRLIKK